MLLPDVGSFYSIAHVRRIVSATARVHFQTIGILVALLDALTITLGSILVQMTCEVLRAFNSYDLPQALGIGLLCSLLFVPIARSFGAYRLPVIIEPLNSIRKLLICCAIVILSVTAILFLLKVSSSLSRGALAGFSFTMVMLCLVERFLAAVVVGRLVRANKIAGEAAFLIGDADELGSLIPPKLLRQFGLNEVGRFLLRDDAEAGPAIEAQIAEALALARQHRPRELILAVTSRSSEDLRRIEYAMRQTPLPVKLLPSSTYRSIIERRDTGLSGSMHCLEIQRAPLNRSECLAKRVLDLAGASVALVVLIPLLLCVAYAIKLDSPGPIIFRQRRNGFDEVPFTIYKFRTMTVLEDGNGVVQARRGDARVTRVGAMLRRTSIDELPQLLNVLRGDMSLVGPRPHAMVHDKEYRAIIGDYFKRHHVKPGMTGWAQVHGFRGETAKTSDMQRRVDLDLWYIEHWSLLLDLLILFRTSSSLRGRNAF